MPPSPGARRAARLAVALSAMIAAILTLAASAPAQIVYVRVKDGKSLKRFPANTIDLHGETVLVGEMKAGVSFSGGQFHLQGDNGNNEFWVVNNGDPSLVPYDVVDGAPVA